MAPRIFSRTVDSRGSLRAMFLRTVERHPERPALTYAVPASPNTESRPGRKRWRTLTWHEVAHTVLAVTRNLSRRAPGAPTVAILADTDPRYFLLELAIGLGGGAVQPLYVSATDEELRRAVTATSADLLVVGRSQRARGATLHPRLIALDEIVRLPGVDAPMAGLPAAVEPFDVTEVDAKIAAWPARDPEAALLFLQSTGTTGPARVIEVSERALMAAVQAVEGEASHQFPRFLSFLPTAHISERLLTMYLSVALVGHSYVGGGLASFTEDLRACRPTVFLAPPLLLEAIRIETLRAASASAVGRRLLASVQEEADAILARGLTGGSVRGLGARLFGRRLRRQLGLDRALDVLAGTAPLAPNLQAWFEAAGVPVRDVYGQTELTGATSIAARRGATVGSVGRPVDGIEVRLSERQELLIRSRSALTRYVGDASTTTPALVDGWFHTGDRGEILATGEIVLLGRVQSRLTTRGGGAVDGTAIVSRLQTALSGAEVVLTGGRDEAAIYLYVARRSPESGLTGGDSLRPLDDADPLWQRVAVLVDEVDPHRGIDGWALYEGAFAQATGEVGPTGKLRAWRIHELRSITLRSRDGTPGFAALVGSARRQQGPSR